MAVSALDDRMGTPRKETIDTPAETIDAPKETTDTPKKTMETKDR